MYILCPHCKYKTPAGYVLCKHCGKPLPGAAQPPAPLTIAIEGQPAPPRVLTQGMTRLGRMTDNDVVLADALASRHHAIIRRDEAGRYIVEDLQSANGAFLNGVRIHAPTPVKAGDVLRVGHTTLRFAETPRPAEMLRPEPTLIGFDAIRTRTDVSVTLVETLVPGARRGATFRPKAREGWALKHLVDDEGRDYFILKSLDRPAYLRLTDRDAFFWKLMDGRHSLRDLLVAYLQEYQALGADRLMDLLDELTEKGFLQNVESTQPPAPRGALARAVTGVRAALRVFFQKEFPVQGADGIITRVYQRLAWRWYSMAGQIALALIALAGIIAFASILLRGDQSLFEVQGSVALGLIALGMANTVSIFLHEMGHALTVKSYNRQVRRVGFMIYFGLPIYFVDTSDIWMEPKGPRIQASLAGPYVSFLVGSATSLAMLVSPSPLVTALLFKLAAWSYIDAFFNLNPLMELDGYFILMDWLEMPLLRKRSLEFVRRQLWEKLRQREAFAREEKLFAVFGVLSVLWSAVAVGMVFFYWRDRIVGLLQGEPVGVVGYLTVILLGLVLALIAARARGQRAEGGKQKAEGRRR